MNQKPSSEKPIFTQIDVTHTNPEPVRPAVHTHNSSDDSEQTRLLRELLSAQDRQNELLEELVSQSTAMQRQRAAELSQWKQANPYLSRQCREAADTLGKVQAEFLRSLTEEVCENGEVLMDGEFMLQEFVDRFGPRLAHLNGVLQILGQLGTHPIDRRA